MTPRQRVAAAMAHTQPDFTPCDYFGTPEIRAALESHFGVTGDNAIRERLGADIRYLEPPYTGPPLPEYDDGSIVNVWGIRRRPMPNEYGEYSEPVGLPYAEWTTVEEAEQFPWPDPDWYDYDAVPAICDEYPDAAISAGSFHVQDFINNIAMGRGVEQVLLDIATEDPVYLYILEKRQQFYLRHMERILDAANGRIDIVFCGDDFGSQRGPLISPASFEKLFAPKKKELFDLAHSYNTKISHHCCGSSRRLIPNFVACGMDALQTIQPQAKGMNPYELKADFGEQIVLHGAVDVQGWLQKATVEQIRDEVNHLMDEVGLGGGFILGPCHHIQPDTPIENVMAVYETVAERRGTSLG